MQSQPESEGLLPGEVRGWWPKPDLGTSRFKRVAAGGADSEAVSPDLPLALKAEFSDGRPQAPP